MYETPQHHVNKSDFVNGSFLMIFQGAVAAVLTRILVYSTNTKECISNNRNRSKHLNSGGSGVD